MDETSKDAAPGPTAAVAPANGVGRRDFLARALQASGGVFALLSGGAALGGEEESYDWEAHRWAYLVDTQRCIGCGACVRACKAENGVPDGYYRTWVERYVVSPEASHVDSPNGGAEGFPPVQVGFEPTRSFFVPKLCNHCTETPCVQVCPVGALSVPAQRRDPPARSRRAPPPPRAQPRWRSAVIAAAGNFPTA